MTINGWIQIAIYFAVLTALVVPLGRFMARVFEGERTFLTPGAAARRESGSIASPASTRTREQHWITYTVAMLLFNAAGFLAGLRAAAPAGICCRSTPPTCRRSRPTSSFNTAVSFTTNTNWQNYGGESTMSYLTPDGRRSRRRTSCPPPPASRSLIALIRAFARASAQDRRQFLGRPDAHARSTCCCRSRSSRALILVWQGVPQNLGAYVDATTLEGAKQTLSQGPAASQIAIKQLGTNGGGFWNANSAVPFENPTPISNFLQLLFILLISGGADQHVRPHGRATSGRAGRSTPPWRSCSSPASSSATGPKAAAIRISPRSGSIPANMEGKEVRFGIANSSLWAVATTAASNGSVNSMHDSFTPLGGMIPMVMIQLGEIIYGGVGSGLYGMLLMRHRCHVRRRPDGRPHAGISRQEDRGQGGQDGDARHPDPAAVDARLHGRRGAAAVRPCRACRTPGPHGFSEVLYLYTSQTGNNGSAFAGLTGNTLWYNTTGGLAMLVGRYFVIVPMMAVAGSLVAKKTVPASAGTFPTHGPLFVGLLVGVILIVGGLTFFPALALGPIVEHFAMTAGSGVLIDFRSDLHVRANHHDSASGLPVSALLDPKVDRGRPSRPPSPSSTRAR